jgi:hypothetical protein
MSSNKSIAVWCVPQAAATRIQFDVHFNYWRVAPPERRFERYRRPAGMPDFIEVGVMIADVKLVEQLSLFLPTKIVRSAISDCSRFFTDQEAVQGIFNERLTPHGPAAGAAGPLLLRKPTSRIFCRMHRFALIAGSAEIDQAELAVRPYAGGTLCTIESAALRKCEGIRGASRAYIRLRIVMPGPKHGNPFVEDLPVYDRMLLSGYDQIEYLDFRLNEARTLPTMVENRMASDQPAGSAAISLVAFLTAVPVSAELSANSDFHKMRLLENRIWSAYAPGIPSGMVVYHWKRIAKKGKPIGDFSAFVKLQIRRSNRSILVNYLVFAFLFGVLGNLVASSIQPLVEKLFAFIATFLSCLFARPAISWLMHRWPHFVPSWNS